MTRHYRFDPYSEEFWTLVDRSAGPDACWPWQHSINEGYGTMRRQGRRYYAHRVAYELERGPIPEDVLVCHHCDNPPCCNPSHLFLGTTSDNMADKVAKGRQRGGGARGDRHPLRQHPERVQGTANPSVRLTEQQVLEIRRRYPRESLKTLGHAFGVHPTTIHHIVRRRAWTHI